MYDLENRFSIFKLMSCDRAQIDLKFKNFMFASRIYKKTWKDLELGFVPVLSEIPYFDYDFLNSQRLNVPLSIVFPHYCFYEGEKKLDHFEFRLLGSMRRPKYMKSRSLYKGEAFFGRVADKDNKNLIITEGARDVCSFIEMGFPNVISLAHKQRISYDLLENLGFHEGNCKVIYDNDLPGQMASQRITSVLKEMEYNVENLSDMDLGRYKDISEAFQHIGKGCVELFDFR
jgi:5S rRNA maturation endonuclease (ribonuclease M5)